MHDLEEDAHPSGRRLVPIKNRVESAQRTIDDNETVSGAKAVVDA